MKRIIYIYLATVLLCGCSKKEGPIGQATYQESLITGYWVADQRIALADYATADLTVRFSKCRMVPPGNNEYNKYRDYYKDYFNRYNKTNQPYTAIATEFESINIVCETNFDAEHPAGTSLNDIIVMKATSLYPYISGGLMGDPKYTYIEKPLSEISPDDLKLLGSDIRFKFTKPRPTGEHIYTVTLITKDEEFVVSGKMYE